MFPPNLAIFGEWKRTFNKRYAFNTNASHLDENHENSFVTKTPCSNNKKMGKIEVEESLILDSLVKRRSTVISGKQSAAVLEKNEKRDTLRKVNTSPSA